MFRLIKQKLLKTGKVVRRLFPSRKHWAVMSLLFLSIALVGFALSAHTTSAILETVGKAIGYGLAWIATTVARLFLSLAIFFMRFFLQLGAYNDYLNAPVVKIGWVMVRDVANMFFVVALLVIAFATILGRESYEWKKTMAKLVLMAIFVNFSMMITGILIDAAHVFTVTFLNAIAPIAGGNLINMFHLDEIGRIVSPGESLRMADGVQVADITVEIFLGAVFSAMFAGMVMVIMAAYAGIMLFRMVFLWILIILSPLAYIFSILPATQSYAKEWWDEFVKYLIVAPIMVFFMWLAFASLGAGDAGTYLSNDPTVISLGLNVEDEPAAALASGQSGSFNMASTWSNMAALLIAMGFLYTGVDRVQKLGVKGSEWARAGIDFGKKVGGMVSGATTARWAGRGAWSLGKKGAKVVAMRFPVIGGRNWRRLGWRISDKIKETPYLRHIPLLGIGGEYHEQLDNQVKKRLELNKQARQADMLLDPTRRMEKAKKMKRRAEGRALSVKADEDRAAATSARIETRVREWGQQHIEQAEDTVYQDWKKKRAPGQDSSEEAFHEAFESDAGLRKQMEEELKKPFKGELIIEGLETGKEHAASFDEREMARGAALGSFMEREKELYTARKERAKGATDAAYVGTALGRERFFEQIQAELGNYGQKEIDNIKSEDEQAILSIKQERLLDATLGWVEEGEEPESLEDLKIDPVIRAILAAEQKTWTDRGKMKVEKGLGSDVAASYVDPEKTGKALPSTAATEAAEQIKNTFNQLTEGEMGHTVAKNHLLLARLDRLKEAGVIDGPTHEQLIASAAIKIASFQKGNADDGAVSLADQINLLESYRKKVDEGKTGANLRTALEADGYDDELIKQVMNDESRADLERNAKISQEFGWVMQVAQKDEQGNVSYQWSDNTCDEAMTSYALWSLTGDREFTRQSVDIGRIMENKKDRTWREASEIYYGTGEKVEIDGKEQEIKVKGTDKRRSYKAWFRENSRHQDLMRGFLEVSKEYAQKNGHTQFHSWGMYDEKIGGQVRLAGAQESLDDKHSTLAKVQATLTAQGLGAKSNKHQELRRIDTRKLSDTGASTLNTMQQINSRTNKRARQEIFGAVPRDYTWEKVDGYAEMGSRKSKKDGGRLDQFIHNGFGDEDLGEFLTLFDVELPHLQQVARGKAMYVAEETKQNAVDAMNGIIKIRWGDKARGGNMEEYVRNLLRSFLSEAGEKIKRLNDRLTTGNDPENVKSQMRATLKRLKSQIDVDDDGSVKGLKVGSTLKTIQEQLAQGGFRLSKQSSSSGGGTTSGSGTDGSGTGGGGGLPPPPPVPAVQQAVSVVQTKVAGARTNAGKIDEAADAYQDSTEQNIPDDQPVVRRQVVEATEKMRQVAKTGGTGAEIDDLAQNVLTNLPQDLAEAVKNALLNSMTELAATLKSNVVKIDADGLKGQINGSVNTAGVGADLQQQMLAAMGKISESMAASGNRDGLLGNLRQSAAQIEDKNAREQMMKLFKEMRKSKNKNEEEDVANRVELNITQNIQSNNSNLAQEMRRLLGEIKNINVPNLDEALDEIAQVNQNIQDSNRAQARTNDDGQSEEEAIIDEGDA